MRRLTNNLGLKFLALLIAAALSAYVYYEINYPVPDTLYLTLEPQGLAPDLVVVNELPLAVAVSVRGPYRAIRLERGRDVHATLDLSALDDPVNTRVAVSVPHLGDLVVTHIEPSDVPLQLDRGKSRRLPVQVDPLGQLDARYVISDEQWEPKTVRVSGPDSLLDRIEMAIVEPDLSKLNTELDAFDKGTSVRLGLILLDENHERINSTSLRLEPPEVEYSLSIVPASSIRVLKVIPSYTGQPPGDHLLSSLTAKPQYVPVPSTLVKQGDFAIRTDPIDLSSKQQSFLARPKLIYPFKVPAGANLPTTAEVTVEIISLKEEGLGAMKVEINVTGKRDRYEYVVTPPQLKVVSKRVGVLSADRRREIIAEIDAAGLAPGDHRLVPQLRLPEALDDARINPSWVTLTVIEKGR
jgi:YbbR domain-containing protein